MGGVHFEMVGRNFDGRADNVSSVSFESLQDVGEDGIVRRRMSPFRAIVDSHRVWVGGFRPEQHAPFEICGESLPLAPCSRRQDSLRHQKPGFVRGSDRR